MHLDELLKGLKERGGSDLYLTAESPPLYRIDGKAAPASDQVMRASDVEGLIRPVLSAEAAETFAHTHELNLARMLPGVGRFRINVFQQRGQIGLVARLIPIDFPKADELKLPPALIDLVMQKRGLVLVTGATGS